MTCAVYTRTTSTVCLLDRNSSPRSCPHRKYSRSFDCVTGSHSRTSYYAQDDMCCIYAYYKHSVPFRSEFLSALVPAQEIQQVLRLRNWFAFANQLLRSG